MRIFIFLLKFTLIPAISAKNFNFLKSHLESVFKTLSLKQPDIPEPTEFPVLDPSLKKCFKCAVNIADRKICRKRRPNLKPYQCKKLGCCYNGDEKQCYRPSKKECPVSKCEAKNIKKRQLFTDRSICPYCWDGKRDQCYLPDEPVCVDKLDEGVEYKRCGWKRIRQKFCELEEGCCWNKERKFCYYGQERPKILELTNFTSVTEIPETTSTLGIPLKPNIILTNITNQILDEKIKIPEQIKKELDQLLSLEEINLETENINKPGEPTDEEHSFEDEEHARTSVTEILHSKEQVLKMRKESMEKAVNQCAEYAKNFVENKAAELNCQKMMFKKYQHSLAKDLCSEKMTREQQILKCIRDFDREFPLSSLKFPDKINHQFIHHKIPVNQMKNQNQQAIVVQPPKNIGFNQIIAKREAERRCEKKYLLTQSKDFKRCVVFTMPSILRDLDDTPIYRNAELTADDKAMERLLRNACFSKMEEFDLCKILALSGRPLASLKNEVEEQTLDPLLTLINAEVDSEDLIPIMFTSNFNLQDPSTLTSLAKIKTRRSLEEDVLTKLVTTFSDDITTSISVKINPQPGPNSDCLKTLFLNVIDPGFKKMSYFTSSAKKHENKIDCENAGFCWTEYSIDTIVEEAYGAHGKEQLKTLFMFTPQIDRILGDDSLSLFKSKCLKKASESYVNMVRFNQLRI